MSTGTDEFGTPHDQTEFPNANTRQVGGSHYRALNAAVQHWDLVAATGMGYFEGQITRYLARHRRKHGAEDLEKAKHYTDKLIELVMNQGYMFEHHCTERGWRVFKQFAIDQHLTNDEYLAFDICIGWIQASHLRTLREIIERIK